MEIHHGLLHGMQRAVAGCQMLHCHDMGAVQRAQKTDAGIDAFITQRTVQQPPDQHRARAAVAFRAAFLGPGQPLADAEVIEKRVCRSEIPKRDRFAVEDEADRVVHAMPCFLSGRRAGFLLFIYARPGRHIDFRFGNSFFP